MLLGLLALGTGYLLIYSGFKNQSPVDSIRQAFGQRPPSLAKVAQDAASGAASGGVGALPEVKKGPTVSPRIPASPDQLYAAGFVYNGRTYTG